LATPDLSASRALGPETALPGAPSFSINATIVCSERPNRDTPALQLLVERCRPKKRLPQRALPRPVPAYERHYRYMQGPLGIPPRRTECSASMVFPEAVFCLRPMVLKNSALKIS
jgi:hypothetical protein